jgi:hypothetical protein
VCAKAKMQKERQSERAMGWPVKKQRNVLFWE